MKRLTLLAILVLAPAVLIAAEGGNPGRRADAPVRPEASADLKKDRDAGGMPLHTLQSAESLQLAVQGNTISPDANANLKPRGTIGVAGPAAGGKFPSLPPAALERYRSLLKDMTLSKTSVSAAAPSGAKPLNVARDAAHEGIGQGLPASRIEEIKKAGEERLLKDREAAALKMQKPSASSGGGVKEKVSAAQGGLARKTSLLPLPAAPAKVAAAAGNPARLQDIKRITAAQETVKEPDERDRLKLNLAAAHVGAGQIEQARAIYEGLKREAAREGIRQTAARNLEILSGAAPQAFTPRTGTAPSNGPAKSAKGGTVR